MLISPSMLNYCTVLGKITYESYTTTTAYSPLHSSILSTINIYMHYIPYAGSHGGVRGYLR